MERRKFSDEFKEQVLKECRETGNTALVARRHNISPNPVHSWRIPGLEEKIGEPAINEQLENNDQIKDRLDALNALCEEFLENYGGGNFARTARDKFKTVQYFTVSSLGHNEDGKKYEPKNVEEPVLWLLKKYDSSMF